ncbi:kinase D-interacting substrate of 220 kDa B-like [Tribolium madens]|uniref:kinase D-interacting substrate of 220 kDa B-like n=1 Tax=Tribolium madens TaxID=41895 RepID=UPI001CF75A98|nr:kinase D-interacting substrate of 220 kDa B-like [Tribolium madens]
MVSYAIHLEKSRFLENIRSGNLEGVENYVSWKFPLNFIERNGYETPLTAAIVAKKFDVVKYLVENEVNVDYKDGKNCTPLHVAIYEECPLDILKLLINKDASIKKQNYRPSPQNTQSLESTNKNISEDAEISEVKEADLEKQEKPNTITQKTNEPYFPQLYTAICSNKLYKARQLLEDGADVCETDSRKETPLVKAVEFGNLETIKLLFEFGADVTMQTAFLKAITLGKIDIINFFITNKVIINCNYRNGTTPLIEAVTWCRNLDVVKILIENGADVNFTSNKGDPLFKSLERSYADCDIAKYLISKGAKMAAKWLKKLNSRIVKHLIEMEVELKSILLGDFVRNTIIKAVETKSALVVKYLLEQGLPIDLYDKNTKSPLAVAAKNGSYYIVKLLVDAGADIYSAKEELDEFANQNNDFYVYYQSLKSKLKPTQISEVSVDESHEDYVVVA